MTALILLKDFLETQIELWRPVEGFDGYDVSNLGRVRSWRKAQGRLYKHGMPVLKRTTPKILQPCIKETGRLKVTLCRDARSYNQHIHQLVARAFIPNLSDLPEINHITGNHKDNRQGNLEWIEPRGNREHAKEFGLYAQGERNPNAKLTNEMILEIRQRCASGESQRKVAKSLGVSQALVGMVNRREIWRHV